MLRYFNKYTIVPRGTFNIDLPISPLPSPYLYPTYIPPTSYPPYVSATYVIPQMAYPIFRGLYLIKIFSQKIDLFEKVDPTKFFPRKMGYLKK